MRTEKTLAEDMKIGDYTSCISHAQVQNSKRQIDDLKPRGSGVPWLGRVL